MTIATQRPLRVLQITVSDQGGAGIACIRLHRALRELDIDSRVLVHQCARSDEFVVQADSHWRAALRFRLDRLPLGIYRRRKIFAWWSVNWLRSAPRLNFGDWKPDIVHAHWIGNGFVPLGWLSEIHKPVVWTMHDMWPFTGGCHYAGNCERYQNECGNCPQLDSREAHDLSFRSLARKAEMWNKLQGVAVSPSHWLAETARGSAALRNSRIEVIPNGLEGTLFKPATRAAARRQLGLREDERVVLTGAVGAVDDERKGFALLTQALRMCSASGRARNWRLLVFGSDSGPGEETVGIPVSYCGSVRTEDRMASIYQASDIYALPSLQDNLPNTVVEALACGKPTVGFRVAGMATMIREGSTGWLAAPFSADDLATTLQNALELTAREEWSPACREEFERVYAWPRPAQCYIRLYREMIETSVRHDCCQ